MKASDMPSAHPQAVLREEFDDYAVLFQPLFGEAFGLDPVGVVVWKLLDGRRTLAQVAAEVTTRCEDAPDTVLEDTLAFAHDLHRRLFIVVSPEEAVGPVRDDRGTRPGRRPPVTPHDEFSLALADGTRLTLRAGDETAAGVVSFLAEAAQLPPAPSSLPPGARRLLAVTGVERDDANSHSRPRYVSPVPAGDAAEADANVVCVLAPPDATRPRRRLIGEVGPRLGRGDDSLFVLEPLTEEQWLWQQLVRLSAAVGREAHAQGGVMLHSGLAQAPHHRRGAGILLAGRSGVGKSTASQRLPLPWRALADDVTLVVRDGTGAYWAHPWPTWSRLVGDEAWEEGYSWNVQQAVPLRAIFFLEQGEEDQVEPLGPGHALCALAELAQQTSRYLLQDLPLDEIAAFHQQRFDNLCDLVQAVPAYLLHTTLHGAFWEEIGKVL